MNLDCAFICRNNLNTPPAGVLISKITVGSGYQTCAITLSSDIVCWSENNGLLPGRYKYSSVGSGWSYNCALTTGGQIVCWGGGGCIGTIPSLPTTSFAELVVGRCHFCAITSAGAVSCWGYNGNGQCNVVAGTYTSIDVGDYFTCGVAAGSGQLVCWGRDPISVMNANYGKTIAPATNCGGSSKVIQVACGSTMASALCDNGAVLMFGETYSGELSTSVPKLLMPVSLILANIPPTGTFVLGTTAGTCDPGTVALSMPYSSSSLSVSVTPLCSGVCPPGSFNSIALASPASSPSCFVCPAGSYCGIKANSSTLCPPGSYGASVGLSSAMCSGLCPLGYYCLQGAIASTNLPCPPGKYS
jgi:hypothetical protein